jgi:hypothetical protein
MKIIRTGVLCLCAMATFVCRAQEPDFLVGVEGGGGLSTLRGNQVLNNLDPLLGYTGGLWIRYDFKRFFTLKTGVYYDLKGTTGDIGIVDTAGNKLGTFKVKQSFNYISVPLLARLNFGKKVSWFINAGPYMCILLRQTVTSESALIFFPSGESDGTNDFNRTDFGVSMGIGLSFTIDKIILSMEARDNLGLINISKLPLYGSGSIKTNAANMVFGIGYKLGAMKGNGVK